MILLKYILKQATLSSDFRHYVVGSFGKEGI